MSKSLRKPIRCPDCDDSFWVFGWKTRTSDCPHCGAVIEFDPETGSVLYWEILGECEVVTRMVSVEEEKDSETVFANPEAPPELVDVSAIEIDARILGLVPESVARDNCVLPIDVDLTSITVVIPLDQWPCEMLLEKLEFILGRRIVAKLASRESILNAIDSFYTE